MDRQDLGSEKEIKVNCSFCGNGMVCPEHMLENAKRHMCYKCFAAKEPSDEEIKDVHVDIPTDKMPEIAASGMADMMVEKAFSGLWSERKNELKEMSKKDLAVEMFGAGVYLGVKSFMESMKQAEEEEKKEMVKEEKEESVQKTLR